MLEVQKFLRSHPLEDLTNRFAIQVKRHGRHPHLVLLKYNQINSPMGERIVEECRGLILDQERDWAIVSYPYMKFYNHGEPYAAPLDWSTARVYEKLDGSLIVLYHYAGEWQAATSGQADGLGS